MNPFEDWNSTELADALLECDEFVEDHIEEGDEETLWEDRQACLEYAEEYLSDEDED